MMTLEERLERALETNRKLHRRVQRAESMMHKGGAEWLAETIAHNLRASAKKDAAERERMRVALDLIEQAAGLWWMPSRREMIGKLNAIRIHAKRGLMR